MAGSRPWLINMYSWCGGAGGGENKESAGRLVTSRGTVLYTGHDKGEREKKKTLRETDAQYTTERDVYKSPYTHTSHIIRFFLYVRYKLKLLHTHTQAARSSRTCPDDLRQEGLALAINALLSA